VGAAVYRFGEYRLDCNRFELAREGQVIRIERKPMELLILLLERNGQLVTRSEITERLWSSEVFVDTEHGINTAIRKVRQALGDEPESPRYILTVTGKGYRFAAPVEAEAAPEPPTQSDPPVGASQRRIINYVAALACLLIVAAGVMVYRARTHRPEVAYTQLTDFTDSAVAPALSPDGRMLAFIRGDETFMSTGQVYLMTLPNGEPRRLTNDDRPKYGLAFSPDASQIAYTVFEAKGFSTYAVPVSGGDPQLMLSNAAGLVWLSGQQLLFSQIASGIHMGVVSATASRDGLREIYFPEHERAMAHYSFPSPDHTWALVVEMDANGNWAPCKLIGLDGRSTPKSIGPDGPCTAAGWSPDGEWMYFAANISGENHLWRQRFPDGSLQQITSGATEERGIAVDPTTGSLITSVGARTSSLWIHDPSGEHALSTEGEVDGSSPPEFSKDGTEIYYLLRHGQQGAGAELWKATIQTGASEAVFPGTPILAYDVSPDGKQVVYASPEAGNSTQLWIAPVDKSLPPRKVGDGGATWPHFGPSGQIVFQQTEGTANYLEQMKSDGSARARVVPYPIGGIESFSPSRRWVTALVTSSPQGPSHPAVMNIPVEGGPLQQLCEGFCVSSWSTSGKFLLITVEISSPNSPGRSLAIPLGPEETLPPLPLRGIPAMALPSIVKGAVSVPRANLVPGRDMEHFAYVNATVHRNLYRISLH
jgi:Tol biopolymer transport system component/DNA-binding winged helix-turn-helix (wHTH) protein